MTLGLQCVQIILEENGQTASSCQRSFVAAVILSLIPPIKPVIPLSTTIQLAFNWSLTEEVCRELHP